MSTHKLVPMEPTQGMIDAYESELNHSHDPGSALESAILYAPEAEQEPVAWQFYQDGKWWNGDDHIKDHRKNTEQAGILIRDLYTAPQPALDVATLVEALAIAREYVLSTLEEKKQALAGYPQRWEYIQEDLAKIDAALAAYRNGGES